MAVEDIKIELSRPPSAEPEKPGKAIDLSKTSLIPRTFSVTGMTCSLALILWRNLLMPLAE
jgi:Cu+-exporting ATPase